MVSHSLTAEMKASQKIKINWSEHEHGRNFRESLQELRDNESFLDVTLVCEDATQIKAHKNILSASSDFFRRILRKNPHPDPLLYLRGIQHSELLPLVEFIYLGEVEIAQEKIQYFLDSAKELKIKGLIEMKDVQDEISGERIEKISIEDDTKHEMEIINVEKTLYSSSSEDSRIEHGESNTFQNNLSEISEEENNEQLNLATRFEDFFEKEDDLWKCKECGKIAKTKSHIKSHIETHIKGTPRVKCDICERFYKSFSVLNAHRRQNHKY